MQLLTGDPHKFRIIQRGLRQNRLKTAVLMGQYHIVHQLYNIMKDIEWLYNMNIFVKNTIVQECLHYAI